MIAKIFAKKYLIFAKEFANVKKEFKKFGNLVRMAYLCSAKKMMVIHSEDTAKSD